MNKSVRLKFFYFFAISVLIFVILSGIRFYKYEYGSYLNGAMTKQYVSLNLLASECRLYSNGNKGRYPAVLEDLYPEYADYKALLKFENPDTKKLQSYIYFSGLTTEDFPNKPLIVSPSIKNGLRLVAPVYGDVLRLTEKEYSDLMEKDHTSQP